jgi:hypothetical protein
VGLNELATANLDDIAGFLLVATIAGATIYVFVGLPNQKRRTNFGVVSKR